MRSMKSLLFVAAVLLLVPAAAFANGGWMMDARAGVGLPMGDYGDVFKSGLLINVEATRMMSTNFGLGLEGSYLKNSPTDDYQAAIELAGGPGTDADAKFMHYGVHGKYFLGQSSSKMMPYMVAGLGLYNAKFEVTPPGGPDISESETKFGLRGGLGMNMMMGPRWGLGFQADYNDVMTSDTSSQYIGISGGLHFMLSPASASSTSNSSSN